MGWTFYRKPEHRSVREECDTHLNFTNSNGGVCKVLKSAMKGATYYAAVETAKPDGSREVWAAVFLTKSRKRDPEGMTFGYKDMDETVGPCEAECPASILDLLTPTTYEHAIDWRARCRANLIVARKPKPKVGQTIKLADPIKFTDGNKLDTFRVTSYTRRGKNYTAYRSIENGGLYRLGNINKLAYEIVEGAA
jgi:hypothetical protein